MDERRKIQRMLVASALRLVPPEIRKEVYEDSTFLSQWNIASTKVSRMGADGPSFQRSALYDCLLSCAARRGHTDSIPDQEGNRWNLTCDLNGDSLSCLVEADGRSYRIGDLSPIAPDSDVRLKWFHRVAEEMRLGTDRVEEWTVLLNAGPLDEVELDRLMSDIGSAPRAFYENLVRRLQAQKFSLAELVPREREYYQRLVGKLGESTTAAEFVSIEVDRLIGHLTARPSIFGLRFALLGCTSRLISEKIDLGRYGKQQIAETFAWLIKFGDPISSIGAIEAGLFHLGSHPEAEEYIEELINQFLLPQAREHRFSLYGAIASTVASEIWRRQILGQVPPFYRRHVAFAHASLVYQAIVEEGNLDTQSIVDWERSSGFAQSYYLRALIDLREEPRWLPDYLAADQLVAEFAGRIRIASAHLQATIRSDSLRRLLFDEDSVVATAAPFPNPFLPGPLEGAMDTAPPCPEVIIKKIETALAKEVLTSNSFAPLVNSTWLFLIPTELAEMAAASLRRIRFALDGSDDNATQLIFGLAAVAGTSRSIELANSLRVLTRVLRRRRRLDCSVADEIQISLMAAAAFEDMDAWAQFAGDWLTEIAFEVNDKDSASRVFSQLGRLIQLEPCLALYCSKAVAAAESIAV